MFRLVLNKMGSCCDGLLLFSEICEPVMIVLGALPSSGGQLLARPPLVPALICLYSLSTSLVSLNCLSKLTCFQSLFV